MARFASVYPLVTARALAREFTYEVPDDVAAGAVVEVRFGNVRRRAVVTALDVPPHATTALKPNGYHVMLLELKRPLIAGETVPLTLSFEKAGVVEVTARVEAAGSSAEPAPPK